VQFDPCEMMKPSSHDGYPPLITNGEMHGLGLHVHVDDGIIDSPVDEHLRDEIFGVNPSLHLVLHEFPAKIDEPS